MTKSAIAVPGLSDGQVNTVNIDGSFDCNKIYLNRLFSLEKIHIKRTYGMIKRNSVKSIKMIKIVFVWCVITMPRNHIKT